MKSRCAALIVVLAAHDTSKFSINYKDSQNLRHDGDDIHRNYNNWVQNLAKAIQAEIGGPRTSTR